MIISYKNNVLFLNKKMTTALYIISTLEHAKQNEYKLGIHTGSEKNLISRYTTTLINPIVYYFRYSECSEIIESELKQHFKNERIVNCNGKKLEWIKIELDVLIDEIEKKFIKYENNSHKNEYFKMACKKFSFDEHKNYDTYKPNSYICNRCHKKFYNKSHLNDHINRKFKCQINKTKNNNYNNNNDNYCKTCNKNFSRPYTYNRHLDTEKHKKNISISINGDKNININNAHDFNIIDNSGPTYNYYFISPFSESEINKLTFEDRIKIFSDAKKNLFDKRNFCLNAIKKSGKHIKMKNDSNYNNILKEGLTFDIIQKIKNKRELIKYILNIMKNDLDDSTYQYILNKINTTINYDLLNKIDSTILNFCFSNDKLNEKIFDDSINKKLII